MCLVYFFFSSRRRHTRCLSDWSSDVCSSDLQGRMSDVSARALHDFVASGHGLLIAGLGWGWLQVAHSDEIREHPGSKLLRDAGIAWADGTVKRTSKDGFSADAPPEGCHSLRALTVLEALHKDVDVTQYAATLTSAVRTLPADEPTVMRRCRELLQKHDKALVPTPKTPISSKQGLERALLALKVELDRELPPEKVHADP